MLSLKMADRLVRTLQLSEEDAQKLRQGLKPRRSKKASESEFECLDMKTFEQIADWVHYAILSLLETTDKAVTPMWIARRLGITELKAADAFERLKILGFVGEVEGRWRQTGRPIKVENTVSTDFTKRFHKEMLEKALRSLERDPMPQRNFSSITLALNPEDIPYACERISVFRRSLATELEGRRNVREVYNFTLQLFPVSQKES